jgi:hypothetical protein
MYVLTAPFSQVWWEQNDTQLNWKDVTEGLKCNLWANKEDKWSEGLENSTAGSFYSPWLGRQPTQAQCELELWRGTPDRRHPSSSLCRNLLILCGRSAVWTPCAIHCPSLFPIISSPWSLNLAVNKPGFMNPQESAWQAGPVREFRGRPGGKLQNPIASSK